MDGQTITALVGLGLTIIGFVVGAAYWVGGKVSAVDGKLEVISVRLDGHDRTDKDLDRRVTRLETKTA